MTISFPKALFIAAMFAGSSLTAQTINHTTGNTLPGYATPNATVQQHNTQVAETIEEISKLVPQDAYALPSPPLSYKNILWSKRVWRTIDARDNENRAFSSAASIPADSRLSHILIKGVLDGKCIAYSAEDDRFTKKLTREDMIALMSNKQNAGSNPANAGFNPDEISKYYIKEDWLYIDTPARHIIVRIVGIAPVRDIKNTDGTITEQPMFWLYYPDIRNYLSQQPVYNYQKDISNYNWDELLDARHFSTKVYKILADTYRNTEYRK